MKLFRKLLSATLAAAMTLTSVTVVTTSVLAAPSISAGWNETLYAEWADSNPDSPDVQVGYKLSTDSSYTYLSGDDLTYLVRPASTSGYGRVDIPGLKAGRYDISIKASDGTVHERKGIKVYEYDRSGYAHWNSTEGIGGYNNDGTPKSNAIVVYVTNENKDTVEVPGYEGRSYDYHSNSANVDYTRTCEGIGNILNNNMKFIQDITITDNHPLIVRLVGKVDVPKNLTPYNTKDVALGGSAGDNGNLAVTKYGRNITIEGIGDDATVDGWGFTFSQTSTCPKDAGKSFEVRNITFKNYTEDALGFQGDDAITCPIERVWVHNNVFYPGYCAKPAESDKAEGDGSCDFKRGKYYTMSYNHYINCHKTNLLGAGDSDDQFYMTLHHNWYEGVASRQPLGAGGNVHIYNTYFDHAKSQTIDLRGKAACFSEANYFDACKNAYKSRKATSNIKTYNDYLGTSTVDTIKGTKTVATTRDESGIPDNGLNFPDGTSVKDFDTNPSQFYYNTATKTSDVSVLNDVMDVPEYVKTYAGTLKTFPETESGEILITVKSGANVVTDATVTANGLSFRNNGDGTYSATASLGAEYVITVSKEGYSNEVVTSTVLNNDGDVFAKTVDLKVDYDGYAVVKLTGGTNNEPVKGASVVLTKDNSALVDQGDGTYKSAKEIATGDYEVSISNTGDYIAPTSAQKISVKTTNAATEIHLDKYKGAVSVTLQAADGETATLDPSKATVTVGGTALTYNNGAFTGTIDVNTPSDVNVTLAGWNTVSVTPAKLTATKEGTATAVAIMKNKGQLFTWNYTDGTNTENFFVFGSDLAAWSSATEMTYEGLTLTKAIKVSSKTSFTFEAPTDGVLTLVMEAKEGSSVKVNGESVTVKTGINTIPVKAGTNTVTKGKNETHLYLAQYGVADEPTTDATTETTTNTVTNTTTEVTTDKATETTTENTNPDKPKLSDDIMWAVDVDLVEGNGLTVGEPFFSNSEEDSPAKFSDGKNTYELSDWVQPKGNPYGEDDTNPVNTTGIPVKGGYVKFTPAANGAFTMAVKTGSGKITYVTDENGKLITKIDNTGKSTSYDILSINVSSDKTYYVFAGGSKICLYYLGFTAGKTVPATEFVYGDVDGNGTREISDVNMLIEQIRKGKVNKVKGINDVNEDGVVDSADVAVLLQKILNNSYKMTCEPSNNPSPSPVEPTTEATTAKVETTTETTTVKVETTTEATTAKVEPTTEATTVKVETTTEATTAKVETTTEATTAKADETTEATTQATASDDYFNFDNSPAITKDGTSGITYTVSTKEGQATDNLTAEAVITDYNGSKALYLNDQSATDSVKVNIPLTEKNSGTVTYTAKITPTVAKGSWTVFMLNGVKADDTEGEVLGLRLDKSKNYGLRVNGGADVTSTTTAVAANTTVTVTITVDFDNDKATLTVNGGTPVTVTGVDAKSIKSMAFQTATDARSLYIDNAGIINNTESTTETSTLEGPTESTTENTTESTTEGTTTEVPAGSYVHNFTTDGKTSTFFTITSASNLAKDKGTVIYNGLTLTQCLKMETSTSITFTAPTAGKLILVFNANDAKHNCKFDNVKVDSDSNGIVTLNVTAGAHSITKRDSSNLYYMVFTPNN